MKKISLLLFCCATIYSMAAKPSFHENVEVKQDKSGRIEISSNADIYQVKCFNEDGKRLLLNVEESKKTLHIANKLEKGTWYFQVKTISGHSVFQKVTIQ